MPAGGHDPEIVVAGQAPVIDAAVAQVMEVEIDQPRLAAGNLKGLPDRAHRLLVPRENEIMVQAADKAPEGAQDRRVQGNGPALGSLGVFRPQADEAFLQVYPVPPQVDGAVALAAGLAGQGC
jgi:hypothetical protein